MKRISGGDGLRSGKATIQLSKDEKTFRVTFDEDGFKKDFDKVSSPSATRKGIWFVTLMADDEEIMGLRPINAMCKGKFTHFAAGEDEIPSPSEYEGKFGKYLAFTALLTLGGEFKGMVQPLFLVYKFAEYEGVTVLKGSGRWVDMCQSFIEAGGIWDQDIPFSDNLLPTFQKMLLTENKIMGLAIKDGYVDSIMELPDQASESDDDFESPAAVETGFDDSDEFDSFNDAVSEPEDIPF